MGRESRMRWPSLNVEGNFRNVIVLFAFSFSQTITETQMRTAHLYVAAAAMAGSAANSACIKTAI